MNDTIIYYAEGRVPLKKSPMPEAVVRQMAGQKVLYVENNSEGVLFVLGGAADDVWGLLYSPSGKINMEGIVRVERAGKDWFYFSSL